MPRFCLSCRPSKTRPFFRDQDSSLKCTAYPLRLTAIRSQVGSTKRIYDSIHIPVTRCLSRVGVRSPVKVESREGVFKLQKQFGTISLNLSWSLK